MVTSKDVKCVIIQRLKDIKVNCKVIYYGGYSRSFEIDIKEWTCPDTDMVCISSEENNHSLRLIGE